MNKVGAYGECMNNMDVLQHSSQEVKKENVTVNRSVAENEKTAEGRDAKEYLYNTSGIYVEDAKWGRVVQKEAAYECLEEAVANSDKNSMYQNFNSTFKYGFVETSTAEELAEKGRNTDSRNVGDRTFATGGQIFDFTV